MVDVNASIAAHDLGSSVKEHAIHFSLASVPGVGMRAGNKRRRGNAWLAVELSRPGRRLPHFIISSQLDMKIWKSFPFLNRPLCVEDLENHQITETTKKIDFLRYLYNCMPAA